MEAQYYVDKLGLLPHPEGGFYKETYRAEGINGDRNYSTAIYFLLTDNNFSALHCIKSDEVWHFYTGETVTVVEIDAMGNLTETVLGGDLERGELFQYTVMAVHWFGSYVSSHKGCALVGYSGTGFRFPRF